jgi:hypothetical protein
MRLFIGIHALSLACFCALAEERIVEPARLQARELKIIEDLGSFNLADLRDKAGPWMIADFSPTSSEIRFANDEDRRRFAARNERVPFAIRMVQGDVGETTPLTKDFRPRERTFFFEFPEYIVISSKRARYTEFSEDSTVICRLDDRNQGTDRYRPFYFIPADGRKFVAPAIDSTARLAKGNFPDADSYERAQAAALADDNPFAALDCWRRVVKEDALKPEALGRVLRHDRVVQGRAICDLLRHHRAGSPAIADLRNWISRATTRDQLLGAELGLAAAYETLGLEGATVARELRSDLTKRALELPNSAMVDEYLQLLADGVSPSLIKRPFRLRKVAGSIAGGI